MANRLICFVAVWIWMVGIAKADPYEEAITAYEIGDFVHSARLLQPIAENGDARAQFNLGQLYEQGKGVNQNFQQAMRWYRLSAVQGNSWAQYNVGQMYEDGLVVERSYVRALMWYNLAASKGLHVAESNRDYITQRMNPEAIAKANVLTRECEARKYHDCE